MADGTPLGPQPDFNLVTASLTSISNEVSKVHNLPTLTNGQRILDVLTQIGDKMTKMEEKMTKMEERMTKMEDRMTKMEERMTKMEDRMTEDFRAIRQDIAGLDGKFTKLIVSSNQNNTARVQNSYVTAPNQPLSPLYSLTDGAAIPDFPATSTQLDAMNRQQVDTVLELLQIQPDRGANLVAKRRMLRAHIGLKQVAV
ncbi:hypothetical protein AYO20_09391 [Fonsecaea nubica]|uniref:Uncharacterized protein n=1 Tax=Fonsecaea nubica TaxID=856822 RepID=A0A178CGM9_9EURO|nr:hypothetical protein AYO20_09391 [Fonsecaea nubica]OAL28667.1 hypothetical protein AYO20_09391 [Fonsecaea nubica]